MRTSSTILLYSILSYLNYNDYDLKSIFLCEVIGLSLLMYMTKFEYVTSILRSRAGQSRAELSSAEHYCAQI